MSVLHSQLIIILKTYRKIVKTILKETKIPLILLLLVVNQLVITFLIKSNFYNDNFNQQFMTVESDSSIPLRLTFEFCTDDVIKIIKLLGPNKAHDNDEISIQMIKL